MITLTTSGDSVVFNFDNNGHYLQEGTIEVPKNSLSLVIDSSDMVTFKKAASNDVFVSATLAELGMTKAELETWFKENAVGGGGSIDSGAVQTMIDNSVSGYADSVLYNSTSKYVEFYHGGSGGTKVYEFDASDFVIDGMVDDVRIETISGVSYLVIDFNTASGKEDIQIPLTDIFDPSNYYTKTEVDGIVSNKITDIESNTANWVGSGVTSINISKNGSQYAVKTFVASINNKPILTGTDYTKANQFNLVETSTYTAYTAATEAVLSGKQDTLSAGTNITISGNVISSEGGGKAIEAGRGISVTTGATADTVSFNLPISADSNTYINAGVGNTNNSTELNILIGSGNTAYNGNAATVTGGTAIGFGNEVGYIGRANFSRSYSFAFGYGNKIQGGHSYAIGNGNNIGKGTSSSKDRSFLIGYYNTCTFGGDSSGNYIFGNYCTVSKGDEFALGKYNVSNTGSTDADKTFFSIGNGTADNARHNAFEIRQNGDIYLTKDGQDVKLQDQLGGGGSSYTAGDGIDITNDVISVTGKVETSAITSAVTSGSTDVVTSGGVYDQLGGMKIVKLTESEYTALVTKDSNTLYVVVPDPSN